LRLPKDGIGNPDPLPASRALRIAWNKAASLKAKQGVVNARFGCSASPWFDWRWEQEVQVKKQAPTSLQVLVF